MTMEEIFTKIYHRNGWFHPETVSGSGSTFFNTVAIREELPIVLRQFGIRSVLDIPCGDCHWIKEIALDIDRYVGADIVSEMIESNRRKITDQRSQFFHWDITQASLPTVDLILCRDCLVHFSLSDAQKAIRNFLRSGSRYLLTTTYPSVLLNTEIETGDWRPINLQKPPFNFPEPLHLVREHHLWHAEEVTDKCLGLWSVGDLPAQPV